MATTQELSPVDVDDRIRRVANLLCVYREITHQELGRQMGIEKSSMSLRMNGKRPFKASEVALMADLLGAPVQAFFAGPEALFGDPPMTSGTERRSLLRERVNERYLCDDLMTCGSSTDAVGSPWDLAA